MQSTNHSFSGLSAWQYIFYAIQRQVYVAAFLTFFSERRCAMIVWSVKYSPNDYLHTMLLYFLHDLEWECVWKVRTSSKNQGLSYGFGNSHSMMFSIKSTFASSFEAERVGVPITQTNKWTWELFLTWNSTLIVWFLPLLSAPSEAISLKKALTLYWKYLAKTTGLLLRVLVLSKYFQSRRHFRLAYRLFKLANVIISLHRKVLLKMSVNQVIWS